MDNREVSATMDGAGKKEMKFEAADEEEIGNHLGGVL
jgi:hypothetical protein